MNEKKVQLLTKVLPLFFKYGIKSLTMDDIARQLSISKKTLYQHFENKTDLLRQGIEFQQMCEHNEICEVLEKKLNAIDENFEVMRVVTTQLKDVHPSVLFDLEKYYPELINDMDKYRNESIYNWVADNLKRGIAEGYFRSDIEVEIIARMYVARIKDFHDENALPTDKYSFVEIYLEIFRYHIRGIASEKGIEYLIEKVKKEKQQ